DRLHRDAQLVGLRAVDVDAHGRLVEGEVAVDDEKQPALARRRLDLFHRVVERDEIAGVEITICTGSPPIEAGSGGSEKTKALIPSTALNLAWSSGLICCVVRLRSFHGLNTMPAMPWLAP